MKDVERERRMNGVCVCERETVVEMATWRGRVVDCVALCACVAESFGVKMNGNRMQSTYQGIPRICVRASP